MVDIPSRRCPFCFLEGLRPKPQQADVGVIDGCSPACEGDSIVGDKRKTDIHTEVERLSRFLFACKLPQVHAKETADVQVWLFGRLPKQARKSTTLDNGVEHFLHTQLWEELGMATYFADPYCSWQRGTNEYTNGLVRRYFPKGTDFRAILQEQINAVVDCLNSYSPKSPRMPPSPPNPEIKRVVPTFEDA
jgi:IS30 family transposase